MKETEEDQDAQEINAILSNKGLTIAEKTRKLRDIRGLTQQVLAARSDMGTRTLQNIENGTTLKPQQHTLEGLAKGLGLDAEHAKRLARTARKRSSEPQAVPTEPQGNSGNIVYIIVPSLENVFWPDVLKGFVTELSPSYNPYHTPPAVMTAATAAPICHGERWESFAAAIEHVTRWRHQAAGCLVVPPRAMPVGVDSDAMVGAIVDKLRDLHHQRVPVVVVDRPLASPPFIWPSNLSAIQGDDETLLSSYEVVRTRLLSATEPERAGELVTRTEWPAELAKVGIHDRAAGYVIGQALVQAYRDAGVNLLPRLHCVLEDKSASVEVMRVEGMEHALQEMAQTLHSSGHLSSPQLPATYVRRYSFEEVMKAHHQVGTRLFKEGEIIFCTTSICAQTVYDLLAPPPERKGTTGWNRRLCIVCDAGGRIRNLEPVPAYLTYLPGELARAAYTSWIVMRDAPLTRFPLQDWALDGVQFDRAGMLPAFVRDVIAPSLVVQSVTTP